MKLKSNLYEEVVKVLSISLEKDETVQMYLHRLLIEIDDLPKTKWNVLSFNLKEWFNKSAKIYSEAQTKDIELPTIEGLEEAFKKLELFKSIPNAETVLNEVKERKKKSKENSKVPTVKVESKENIPVEKSTKNKQKEIPVENKVTEVSGKSASYYIKKFIIENVDISLEDLILKLKLENLDVKEATVKTMQASIVSIIETIVKDGKVLNSKGNIILKSTKSKEI